MRLLITGASRGLGAALAQLLPRPGDEVHLVSRTRPPWLDAHTTGAQCYFLSADICSPTTPDIIAAAIPGGLDVIVHNAGIWEHNAFTQDYDFDAVTPDETRRVLETNLLAPILLTRALLPNLRQSSNAKIIFIGSINGLPNTGFPEVVYGASKWGLRGIADTLRTSLRPEQIGVTVINCGTIGETLHDRRGAPIGQGIPLEDMTAIVRCVVETSRRTVIREINVPAMGDTEA